MDFVSASDAQGRLVCCASKHESCSIDAQELFCSDFCTSRRNWSCLNREGRASRQKQRHKQSMGGDHLGLWSWSDVSVVHLIQDIPL